jgi:hypothetical protein
MGANSLILGIWLGLGILGGLLSYGELPETLPYLVIVAIWLVVAIAVHAAIKD